jgi:hypothetical protein
MARHRRQLTPVRRRAVDHGCRISETALVETDKPVLNDFGQRGTWGGRTISKEVAEFTIRRYRI